MSSRQKGRDIPSTNLLSSDSNMFSKSDSIVFWAGDSVVFSTNIPLCSGQVILSCSPRTIPLRSGQVILSYSPRMIPLCFEHDLPPSPEKNPLVLKCTQTDTEDNHPILLREVEAAVQLLKKGKSAGVDNIPAELVQAGGEDVITALTT